MDGGDSGGERDPRFLTTQIDSQKHTDPTGPGRLAVKQMLSIKSKSAFKHIVHCQQKSIIIILIIMLILVTPDENELFKCFICKSTLITLAKIPFQ